MSFSGLSTQIIEIYYVGVRPGGVYGTYTMVYAVWQNDVLQLTDWLSTMGYEDPVVKGQVQPWSSDINIAQLTGIAYSPTSKPSGAGAISLAPTITYLKVSDLGDGRIWVDYGVQGKGNVKITIDSIVVKTFNNPYDSYSYGDAFPVSAGTHTVCVVGVA